MIFPLVGGIGLFLLGMILLTDGLKSFAGDSLRQALLRFTGRPISAFTSGVVVTALVQSSSATTLATIGFVSAGLLTFPQAIGVMIGASLGTTGTSWIVSTLGLKFSIGTFALPLTGIGAFMRLLIKGKAASLGIALAGLGLIFIGIDTLQEGMRDLSQVFNLGGIAPDGFGGRLLLLLIGIVMTIVMQSSGAAVATTLAALHAGAIQFEHATALVIGAAIGTTFTAVLASIRASVPAKRAALAHVLFNAGTGVIALPLLPIYHHVFDRIQEQTGAAPNAVALAAFHTSFILLGVVIFLPFLRPFARLIERLLPEKGPSLTRNLDASLHSMPAVALETAANVLKAITAEQIMIAKGFLDSTARREFLERQEQVRSAVEETRRFVAEVPLAAGEETTGPQRLALAHALDHLTSLGHLAPPDFGSNQPGADPLPAEIFTLAAEALQLAAEVLRANGPNELVRLEEVSHALVEERRKQRAILLDEVAVRQRDPHQSLSVLDGIRWADSTIYHLRRACAYLSRSGRVATGDESRAFPQA